MSIIRDYFCFWEPGYSAWVDFFPIGQSGHNVRWYIQSTMTHALTQSRPIMLSMFCFSLDHEVYFASFSGFQVFRAINSLFNYSLRGLSYSCTLFSLIRKLNTMLNSKFMGSFLVLVEIRNLIKFSWPKIHEIGPNDVDPLVGPKSFLKF